MIVAFVPSEAERAAASSLYGAGAADQGLKAATLRAAQCAHQLATKLGHMRMKMNGQVEPLAKSAVMARQLEAAAAAASEQAAATQPVPASPPPLTISKAQSQRVTESSGLEGDDDEIKGGIVLDGSDSVLQGMGTSEASNLPRAGSGFRVLGAMMQHVDSAPSNLDGAASVVKTGVSVQLLKIGRGLISSSRQSKMSKEKPPASSVATASPDASPFGSMTGVAEDGKASRLSSGARHGSKSKSSYLPNKSSGSPFERLRTVEGAAGSGSSGRSSEMAAGSSSGGAAGNLWGVEGAGVLQREMSVASKLNLPPSLRMVRGGAGGPPGVASGLSVSSTGSSPASGPSSSVVASRGGPPGGSGGTRGAAGAGAEGSGTSFSPLRGKGAAGPNGRSWESTLQVLTAVTLTSTEAGSDQDRVSGLREPGQSSGNRQLASEPQVRGAERSRLSQTTKFKVVGGELDDSFLKKSRTASDFDLAARQVSWNRQHSNMHKSIFSRAGKAAGRAPPLAPRTAVTFDPSSAGPSSGFNKPVVRVQLAEEGEGEGRAGDVEEEEEEGEEAVPGEGGYQWSDDSYMIVETGMGSSYSSSIDPREVLSVIMTGRTAMAPATGTSTREVSAAMNSEGLGLLSTVNGLIQGAGMSNHGQHGPRSFSREQGDQSGGAGPIAEGTEELGPGTPRGSTGVNRILDSPLASASGRHAGPVAEGFMRRGPGQHPVLATSGAAFEGSIGSAPPTQAGGDLTSPRTSEGASSFISRCASEGSGVGEGIGLVMLLSMGASPSGSEVKSRYSRPCYR